MANGNGNGANKLSNSHPSAMEPTEADIRSLLQRFINERNLKISVDEAMKNSAFLRTAKTLWQGKLAKERDEREKSERQAVNTASETILAHVKERLAELGEKLRLISISAEIIPEITEPGGNEIKSALAEVVKTLGLELKVEQITRTDVYGLMKQLLTKEHELVAKEKAREGQILLDAMRDAMKTEALVIDTTTPKPEGELKKKIPLWKIPLKSSHDRMVEEHSDLIPAWVLGDLENAKNFLAALRGHLVRYRKYLINEEIPRLKRTEGKDAQKLLTELKDLQGKLQKNMIDKITEIFQELFHADPGQKENFCPVELYFSLEAKFDDFFREKLPYVVENYRKSAPKKQVVQTVETTPKSTPPKDAQTLEKRRQLVAEKTQELVNAGFSESDAGPLAAKVIKRFDGDFTLAAIAQCSMLEQQGISEEDKKSIEEKIAKLAKAAVISVLEVKARYEQRKAEMKAAQEKQNEQKYARLKAHDVKPMSAGQARRESEERRKAADKRAQEKAQQKNGKKNKK